MHVQYAACVRYVDDIASYPGPSRGRRAWYPAIAHVPIFPNFSGNSILQYTFRTLKKKLRHVLGGDQLEWWLQQVDLVRLLVL